MKLHHASNHAILLAEWCKDQGLIMGLDFEWAVWAEDQFIEFEFMGRGEKYSSMFALKFGEGSAWNFYYPSFATGKTLVYWLC